MIQVIIRIIQSVVFTIFFLFDGLCHSPEVSFHAFSRSYIAQVINVIFTLKAKFVYFIIIFIFFFKCPHESIL